MGVTLEFNKDLIWQSDFNGYELGYPNVTVVGKYKLINSNLYFYINMDENKILESWQL